eukprot:9777053-Alexandrium_andersonii.AAC.1
MQWPSHRRPSRATAHGAGLPLGLVAPPGSGPSVWGPASAGAPAALFAASLLLFTGGRGLRL